MKTNILLALGLFISITCFSKEKNNFTLVPGGSFKIQEEETPKTISVENFWMSNEITNKEFREFFNQIKNSPNDSITWIDFPSMKNGVMSKPKVNSIAYSDIFNKLMNESAWKSIFENGDYFTNTKYDDYPVIGVTWEGAQYYCMWRTKEENKKLKGQDKVLQMDYRLPTQYEWEYASTFNEPKSNIDTKLHPINKGEVNKIGLLNLNGNVAEWTCTSGSKDNPDYKVVKGSSWKSDQNTTNQELVQPNNGTNYIGFRIVRSDIKN